MWQGWEHAVIAICISYILYHIVNKSKKAKAQQERINRDPYIQKDWDDYLAKLCRITGKNAHELMTIAAQEAGFNYSKDRISKDFRMFIQTGELPGYVIMFLKKGKEHMDKINEGPGCKTQMPGMF